MTTPTRTVDPLGRPVLPNEPIPFQPWWQLVPAAVGTLAAIAMMVYCVDAWLDNVSVLDGGALPFINTGIAMVGMLLGLALFLAYVSWFRKRGGGAALIMLLAITFIPPGIYLATRLL